MFDIKDLPLLSDTAGGQGIRNVPRKVVCKIKWQTETIATLKKADGALSPTALNSAFLPISQSRRIQGSKKEGGDRLGKIQ